MARERLVSGHGQMWLNVRSELGIDKREPAQHPTDELTTNVTTHSLKLPRTGHKRETIRRARARD